MRLCRHAKQQGSEDVQEEGSDLEGILLNLGKDNNKKHGEEDSDIHNSEWSFSLESDVEAIDTNAVHRKIVLVVGELPNLRDDAGMDSDYAGLEKL